MTNRVTYHVTPNVNSWEVKRAGSSETEFLVDNKDNAVNHAKELARAEELGQVIVHTRDGKIAEEFTYGADPRGIKG
ncbi:MAG: DUF2188 domain-containing protein [Actinomycetota bacterium]